MTKLISQYSINQDDNIILEQIAKHLEKLSGEQESAIAIAALYEGFEPSSIEFDYCCCLSYCFDQCISLLQHLSLPGKLALVRAITEHLAVVDMAGQGETRPSMPPVVAIH